MSDVDSIEIIEYNAINSISLSVPSDIDNISFSYENQITNISIDPILEITDIVLNVGNNIQTVFSVNNLYGDIVLTASSTLSTVSPSAGIYSYSFSHNLGYIYPIITIYNTNNEAVVADIQTIDFNSVTIKSVIDLLGYKVVAQR